jgi:N-acyl-D-aspartate/D-glutamate deacylase
VLDASGLIVAPGFVDLHTHYDAQLFWDPYCTLSGWHGVTSVVIGNCGFGFAPARAEHREYLMKTLSRVEAIPSRCMELSLPWSWESFPEWMDVLDRQPKGVNALTYVPLNPLLLYVMGFEAKSRDATEAELGEMARLLGEAMAAGACGWSAQRTAPGGGFDMQRDFDGTPFATDVMSNGTALALGKVLADYEHAFIQTALISGDPVAETAHLEELAAVSESAVIFNAIGTFSRFPEAHRFYLDWIRRCQERGLKIYAQLVTTGNQFVFTFEDWNMFDDSPAWFEVTNGTPAERLAKFRDPSRRQALREKPPGCFPLETLVILKTYSERFLPVKGTLLPDAARILGYDDLTDLLIDMIVADELRTLFQCPQANDDQDLQNELVVAPYGLWGVSDGGAHTKFLTLGAFPTESIIDFVRERGLVTLEEAHWRLSALPAQAAGFRHRGTLVEGAPADIIVYDYDNLTLLDEEVAEDFPGGEWRRVRHAEGYHYTMVNGELTFIDGKPTGTTPGRLLRHGNG